MFDSKVITEINALKDEIKEELVAISSNLNKKLEHQETEISNLRLAVKEIRDNSTNAADKVIKDISEINEIKSDFEKAINKINSIGRSIEMNAAASVKEVAEKEIESIRASSKQFREVEEELKEIMINLEDLSEEMSKFSEISKQVKLVDFSLKSHKEDLHRYERERTRLIEENEQLKSIMAKMKRNRA